MENPDVNSVANPIQNLFSGKKKVLIVLVIVILLVLVGFEFIIGSKHQNSKVTKLIENSKIAVIKGDYKTAQANYNQALKIDKKNSQALSGMIDAISLEGNKTGNEFDSFKLSQPYIDEALKDNGGDTDVLVSVGYAYETEGDYQTALKYYEKAIKADSKSASAWFHRGHVLEFLGEKDKADLDYEKAFELDPNNPQVLMVHGNILLSQANFQASYESFKKASQQPLIDNQTKAEALTAASFVRRSYDNFEHMTDALALSKQAVETDPTFSPALGTHGYNLILIKKTQEGKELIQEAIKANPRITRNYYYMGITLRGEGDYEGALQYLNTAISKAEDDNTVFSREDRAALKGTYTYELAKTYTIAGIQTDTYSLLARAVELNPNMKSQIKADYEKIGFFKELSNNQQFLTMINS